MNAASVILVTLFTSVITSGATVYAIQRLDLVPRAQPPAPPVARAPAPNLRGLSEEDARANLVASGLTLLILGREPSKEVPPGHVLKQSPPAGTPVGRGEAISASFALAMPKVPGVTGLSTDAAATVLSQVGFKLKIGDGVIDPQVPEGKIVSQVPAADAVSERDTVVTVQVSLPPKPVAVPALVGTGFNGAKQKLESVGLKLGKVAWLSIPDQQAFIVMQQDPVAGKQLKPGDEVSLSVNR